MCKTSVYIEQGLKKEYIGCIEDGKIYKFTGKFSDECVGRYEDGKVFLERLLSKDVLATYDERFLYFETLFDKEPVAYLENGKIYKKEFPHHCIGLYDGIANPACISLLLCDFEVKEEIIKPVNIEPSSCGSSWPGVLMMVIIAFIIGYLGLFGAMPTELTITLIIALFVLASIK